MPNKNPWLLHVAKVRKQYPNIPSSKIMEIASQRYNRQNIDTVSQEGGVKIKKILTKKMNESIINYLPLIEEIASKIPTDHFITRTEIDQLDPNALKTLFHYTFPEKFSKGNYQQLNYLVELARRTLIKLPNDSLVIAPGDSPSKVVHLINLLWKIDEDTYRIKYRPLDYGYLADDGYYDDDGEPIKQFGYVEVTKRIKFIVFPLSALQDPSLSTLQALPNYLRGVLDSNGVNYQGQVTFIDLDHIEGGTTHRRLQSALKQLNPDIQLNKLNLADIWSLIYSLNRSSEDNYVYSLIMGAEDYGARCIPSYPDLSQPIPQLNIRKCNLVVTMIYLKALDLLGKTPELPHNEFKCNYHGDHVPEPNSCLYRDLFYDIVYYDLSSNSIEQVRGLVDGTYNGVTLIIINPGVVRFRKINILYEQIVRFEHVPMENIGEQKFPVNSVGIITLINGEKMRAEYTGNSFNTYKWSNELVATMNQSGYINPYLIARFDPE